MFSLSFFNWSLSIRSTTLGSHSAMASAAEAGCTTIFGALHGSTVMVTVLRSADEPHVFDARTQ